VDDESVLVKRIAKATAERKEKAVADTSEPRDPSPRSVRSSFLPASLAKDGKMASLHVDGRPLARPLPKLRTGGNF